MEKHDSGLDDAGQYVETLWLRRQKLVVDREDIE